MKGNYHPRTVGECPHRQSAANASGEIKTVCGLLKELTGTLDNSLCEVGTAVCTACCKQPLPVDGDHLNSVVASRLLRISQLALAADGGHHGLSHDTAVLLKDLATRNLAADLPRFVPDLLAYKGSCFHLGNSLRLMSDEAAREEEPFICLHESIDETTASKCRRCLEYEENLTKKKVTEWAVGVVTAPRRQYTLDQTLNSLKAAGWESPHLFAEAGSLVPDEFSGPVIRRFNHLGAWPNWHLALSEMVMLHPHAEAYLLCQDDVIFCRNLRSYLEATLWPSRRVGVVSLYTAHHFARGDIVGFHSDEQDRSPFGALAYVFPNAGARSLLRDSQLLNHRRDSNYRAGRAQVDFLVGYWARRKMLPYLFHSPSLAQHIGDTSAIFTHAKNRGWRKSSNFVGEEFDAMDLLTEAPVIQEDSETKSELPPKPAKKLQAKALDVNLPRWSPATWPEAAIRCDVVVPYSDQYIPWLLPCVDSLLGQNGVEAIVHLVADGASENPPLENDIMDCGRIRWHRHADNVGPYISLMRIWDQLETPYCAIGDADDVYHPDRIATGVRSLRAGHDIWGGWMVRFPDWRAGPAIHSLQESTKRLMSGGKSASYPNGFIANPTMILTRRAFERLNGFAAWPVGADIEFVNRAHVARMSVIASKTFCGHHRMHDSSLTRNQFYGWGTQERNDATEMVKSRLQEYTLENVVSFGALDKTREGTTGQNLIGNSDWPHVVPILVTQSPNRWDLALDAIRDFTNQSYPADRRSLVVVSDSYHVRVPPGVRGVNILNAPTFHSIGEGRNFGLDWVRMHRPGALVMQWDDDDRYHPHRIIEQVRHWQPGFAVTLQRQIREDMHSGKRIRYQRSNRPEMGIEGTILFQLTNQRYINASIGDDTDMAEQCQPIIAVDNDPELYVRRWHGNNTCSRRHIMGADST